MSPELIVYGSLALAILALAWVLWAWMHLRREARLAPDTAYTRGLSALVGGDRRSALGYFKEAVQTNSENLDAYVRLGDLLRESGDPAKALAIHRDLTVRPRLEDADRIRILESITRDHLALRRFEEAGQSAERLRQVSRQSRFALEALQQVAEALRDWPRAVHVVDELDRLAGARDARRRALYRGWVGGEELAAGNVEEARKRFEEAIKLDPECRLAHLHLGDLAQAAGENEVAVRHWRELAFGEPARAPVVFERMERAYFELGQFGEMISFYRELLHRMTRESAPPALLALAEIHRRKGDLGDAETFVSEALEIDPDHVRAHRHLVKLALDRRDPATALSRLDHLLDALNLAGDFGACRNCRVPLRRALWRCESCGVLNPLDL